MRETRHCRASRLPGLLLCGLAGCAGSPPDGPAPAAVVIPASGTVTIQGALAIPDRTPLPPDSQLVVELRAVDRPDSPVIAEQRMALRVMQAPVPFDLPVMQARLDAGSTYAFRGAIMTGGRARWVSEPVAINPAALDPARPVVDLGVIALAPYTALAFATHWTCGDQPVSIGYVADQAMLVVGGSSMPVQPAISASGARYDAVLAPDTFLWSKGDRATLRVNGRTYPECVHVSAPDP